MIEYRRDKHRFFDDLLTMLNSLSALLVTMEYFREGYSSVVHDSSWPFTLYSVVEKKGLQFCPYALLKILSDNDQWPARLVEFREVSYYTPSTDKEGFTLSSNSFSRTMEIISQSSFIRYYETINPKAKFGSNPQSWPQSWNFARVIRNAFAHGGQIYFRNLNAGSVTWKTQSYSPSDNGRQIMSKDISHGDIILLMEDIDAAI